MTGRVSEGVVMSLFNEAALLYPEWFLEFWMTGPGAYAELLSKSHHPMARILEGEGMRQWLGGQKRKFYERRLVFAEDLIAVACHPSRFVEWTVDWEEKAELTRRWGLPS